MKPPRPSISFRAYGRSRGDHDSDSSSDSATATRTEFEAKPWFLREAQAALDSDDGVTLETVPSPRPALTPRLALPRERMPSDDSFTGTVPLPFAHTRANGQVTSPAHEPDPSEASTLIERPKTAPADAPVWHLPKVPKVIVADVPSRNEHPSFGPIAISIDSRPSFTSPSIRIREKRKTLIVTLAGAFAALMCVGLGTVHHLQSGAESTSAASPRAAAIAPAVTAAGVGDVGGARAPTQIIVELDNLTAPTVHETSPAPSPVNDLETRAALAHPTAASLRLTPEQIFKAAPAPSSTAAAKLTREDVKHLKNEKAMLAAKLAASRAAVRPATGGPAPSVDELVRIQRLRGETE